MGILIFLIIVGAFIAEEVWTLRKLRLAQRAKSEEFLQRQYQIQKEDVALSSEVIEQEDRMSGYFFFYDLIRRMAPILDKKQLIEAFFDEIKEIGDIKRIDSQAAAGPDCLKIDLHGVHQDIWITTKSDKIKDYLPQFNNLLRLCLERIDLYLRLQQLSIYDSLTEVFNRRYFMLRFSEEFDRSKKFGYKLSLLMIDADNFKKINDTYGHLVGDAVLHKIAKLISENLREIDFVARYGGEEFSVVLLDTDKNDAIMVAERICAKISKNRIRAFDESLDVTVSLGVATYPANTLYSDVLLETADKALYKAKSLGKNRVCWF
jgi:diguanylate cyclase (GGDEF)-like protein